MSRPAVFLDRDGVLVEEVYYPAFGEVEAPMRAEDVHLLPGSALAARRLRALGFLLVVVSNQGAAAKGKTDLASLWAAQRRFAALLAHEGLTLDGEYYAFSHPDGIVPALSGPSLERKPSPHNVLVAAARLDVDLRSSWMVGDREDDVACGMAAGVRTIRIARPGTPTAADHCVGDLGAAATAIAMSISADRQSRPVKPVERRHLAAEGDRR